MGIYKIGEVWWTQFPFDELEKDPEVMEKNEDVIAFVKTKIA